MNVRAEAPPWLMIIDLQRVFAESASPWFTPGFDNVLRASARLRSAFGPRVALTRFVPSADPRGAWIRYYQCFPFALDPANAGLFELVPDVPIDDAVLMDRSTFSKWDAGAQRCLDGATNIVLTGVSTDCCVLSTALAAADAGVQVRIAADACAGVDPISHQRALDVMALYAPHIELTSVETILTEAATRWCTPPSEVYGDAQLGCK